MNFSFNSSDLALKPGKGKPKSSEENGQSQSSQTSSQSSKSASSDSNAIPPSKTSTGPPKFHIPSLEEIEEEAPVEINLFKPGKRSSSEHSAGSSGPAPPKAPRTSQFASAPSKSPPMAPPPSKVPQTSTTITTTAPAPILPRPNQFGARTSQFAPKPAQPVASKSPAAVGTTPRPITTTAQVSPPITATKAPVAAAERPRAPTGAHITVNKCQEGNPVLKHIRNVTWDFADIVPDYVVGQTACAFFISLRYHQMFPAYLGGRLAEIKKNFRLRVILCQVDVEDSVRPIQDVTRLAVQMDFTLVLAWSSAEVGRYLETFKAYENKPPDMIQEKVEEDHFAKLTDCLTEVRSVNKTNVQTLASAFRSFRGIAGASVEELSVLPGFGDKKVRRLYDTFREPFVSNFREPKDKTKQSNIERFLGSLSQQPSSSTQPP